MGELSRARLSEGSAIELLEVARRSAPIRAAASRPAQFFLPHQRSAHNYWERSQARQKWLGVRPVRSALTPLTPESALLIKTFRASDALKPPLPGSPSSMSGCQDVRDLSWIARRMSGTSKVLSGYGSRSSCFAREFEDFVFCRTRSPLPASATALAGQDCKGCPTPMENQTQQ